VDDELTRALEDMARRIEELAIDYRQRTEQSVAERGPQNSWLRKDAMEIFTLDDEECWIIKPHVWDEFDEIAKELPDFRGLTVGYNGYVCFKQKPVIEPGNRGILTYIPVHGGITYCVHDEIGSVYGFDTAHSDSDQYPIRDVDWVKNNILLMMLGIRKAAEIEPEYLRADGDNQRRAELVQPLVDLADGLNFGTMINLLSGEL
jgi:hypothetical protein